MKRLDFASLIVESAEQLRELERREKDARKRLRVQLSRLLKNKESASIKDASRMCGITPKHGYDLWHKYQDKGLKRYLQLDWKPRRSKLSDEQQEKLLKPVTEENGFANQQQARQFISDEFHQEYTQAGVSLLFARLKIKAKMPRPKNQKASAEEQMEYKKTLP